MNEFWVTFVVASVLMVLYTYAGYPALLKVLSLRRSGGRRTHQWDEWPDVSITVPAYNAESSIAATLESLLDLDYPGDLIEILVVSDASTDRTEEIVGRYADRGVRLLRMSRREGKTAAENAAAEHLTGKVVVNTDAAVRVHPQALRRLVSELGDPTIGVASGRDVSVGEEPTRENIGESGYVGYEMWIRRLETRVSGIVGASGCLYAIRSHLHKTVLPPYLSRDFASALVARENGYRAVSVDDAICYVPRTSSLRQEYWRKVRTIARGIRTLYFKRHLLAPRRYGLFAWMLFSHKVCRWLAPVAAALGLAALSILALEEALARIALAVVGSVLTLAAFGWLWSAKSKIPKLVAIPAFLVAGNLAVLHAWLKVLKGERNSVWEPTKRRNVVEL